MGLIVILSGTESKGESAISETAYVAVEILNNLFEFKPTTYRKLPFGVTSIPSGVNDNPMLWIKFNVDGFNTTISLPLIETNNFVPSGLRAIELAAVPRLKDEVTELSEVLIRKIEVVLFVVA